jgi:hypothetical protein
MFGHLAHKLCAVENGLCDKIDSWTLKFFLTGGKVAKSWQMLQNHGKIRQLQSIPKWQKQ